MTNLIICLLLLFAQDQLVSGSCYIQETARIAHYMMSYSYESSLAACTSKCDATPGCTAVVYMDTTVVFDMPMSGSCTLQSDDPLPPGPLTCGTVRYRTYQRHVKSETGC